MKDVVQNLNHAIDHLETLEKLCGTIQRRIDNGMDITAEWLSSVTGMIKDHSMSANKIIADEAAAANGHSRAFIAEVNQGIEMALGGAPIMRVQSQSGNVVRIGYSKPYQPQGGDCA